MKENNLLVESEKNFSTNLVSFSLRNPYFIVVLCLLVTIFGVLSYIQLPKDLLPAVNMPAVQVISYYPGMPVTNVEQDLTSRFERYTGQAIGITRQESKSVVGVSIVKNYFGSNIDLNTALTQISTLVMSVLHSLPPGTEPPFILPFDPTAQIPLALVAVNGNGSIQNTYDIARYYVRNAIQTVPGAMAPTMMGGALRQILIYLDPKKLEEYNFSPVAVLKKISTLNTFIPSGDVKIGNLDYQIDSNALVDKIADMNEFPLRAEFGVPIYLKDIGTAEDAKQIQTNVVLINGNEEVYVPIYRQPGGNSIQVVDQVKTAIHDLESRLEKTKLTVVADQSIFVRRAITNIAEEALLGGCLAAIMIFLLLANPSATFGILLSLPLSLLMAFIGLRVFEQTINAMTLGGLALAIGVLVDNSIVVLENINKKLENGFSTHHAALIGTAEVSMPVLTATLATLVVFFPVIFLSGIIKVLFSALAKAVMFAMIGSFLISMTVIPLFASRFLHPHTLNQSSVILKKLQCLMLTITTHYGTALRFALNYRKTFLICIIGLFLFSIALLPRIGRELFPRADAGNFILQLRLASGTRIEKSTEFAKAFEKKLRKWISPHDLRMIITNIGVNYGYPAAFTPNAGSQDMFFNIELTQNRKHSSQYYAKIIRQKMHDTFPHIDMGIQLGGLLSAALNHGAIAPIDVQIQGPNSKKSYDIALHLKDQIKELRGATDVRIQEVFDAPIAKVNIDRKKAMELGINTEDIIKNIASAVASSSTFDSTNIWVDPKTGIDYQLGVQFRENQIHSFADFINIPIRALNRERTIPLNKVATISQEKGSIEIDHVNYQPVVDIYLDAQDRDIGGLSNAIQKIIDQTALPMHYTARIRGEIKDMNSAINKLIGGFILAAILVYLIMVIQFRSFLLPVIIMTSVPLGLIGIVFMFILTNTYFSIQAAIGAIFMIGIAVANGVLLVEFISHHCNNHHNFEEAIINGAKARLRPIIMTSFAAVLGIVPMAIGIGHGSEANIPLGRAVIGGQIFSMFLTLFVVPILYRCLVKTNTTQQSA